MEAPSVTGAHSSTAQTPVRTPAPTVAPAVKTQLPESKAIAAVGEEPAVKLDFSLNAKKLAEGQQAVQRLIEKHVSFDEDMRTVIVKSVDPFTGKTVSQLPDEKLLQLRAYMRDVVEKLDQKTIEKQPGIKATA